jgi:uncharacterized protein (TIGR00299 family) protein
MDPLARIHLDPVGGIAGDMFVAAMADAFPALIPGLMKELAKLRKSPAAPGEGDSRFEPHAGSSLRGQRFVVDVGPDGSHAQDHVAFRDIRARLQAAELDRRVLEHALALFTLLAEAEGQVHGVAPDAVEFHELGAWDSIVDLVAAAWFIATLAPDRWTCAPLPLGGGRVQTAHGVLPIPAPATVLLMRGLAVIDDGIGGERVTPTGAAIARYLLRLAPSRPSSSAQDEPRVLAATGHGFGSRTLPGAPNVLRCLAFTHESRPAGARDDEIATLTFEVDDQTAEDLAVALERIREAPGVLDACQVAAYGKKGRLATQVQVLARLDAVETVADRCLDQTTTLGLRIARAVRRTAPRASVETAVPESVRVKVAARPSGEVTAKAEMDDLARIPGERARREVARARAEAEALRNATPDAGRESD